MINRGNEVEWKGDWSDKYVFESINLFRVLIILKLEFVVYLSSREWNTVSSDIKEEIGLVKDADGEFW